MHACRIFPMMIVVHNYPCFREVCAIEANFAIIILRSPGFTKTWIMDHPNLVKSMEEYPEYLRCVRFNYKLRNHNPPCLDLNKEGSTPADHVNGIDFHSSNTWSDKYVHYDTTCLESDIQDINVQEFNRSLEVCISDTPFHFCFDSSNHLTTVDYYKIMLQRMHFLTRPMEGMMMNWSAKHCTLWGQTIYGKRGDKAKYMKHLDGRLTQTVSSMTV
jgi:hypothetical protein